MPRTADGRQAHPLYRRWTSMRQRCRDPKSRAWKNYGGRGIKICPEWDDFWTFVKDVGLPPEDGQRWTLDRTDNDGNYEPGNVRWATYSEQNANRRKLKHPIPQKCGKGHKYVAIYQKSDGARRCSKCVDEHNLARSLADLEKRRKTWNKK